MRISKTLVAYTWLFAAVTGVLLGALAASCAKAVDADTGPHRDHRYTSGELALRNLGARIQAERAQLERRPSLTPVRAALVGDLMLRATILGSVDDRREMLTLTTLGADAGPRERVLRARALVAVHRFDEALAVLEPLGQRDDAARLRDTILLGRGVDPAQWSATFAGVARRRESALRRRPSSSAYIDLAAALVATGELERADAALATAEADPRETSPFVPAIAAFHRGVIAAEHRGDRASARAHYRRAVAWVPNFVAAKVHLAELEHERGHTSRALDLLRSVRDSEDPEPLVRIGQMAPAPEAAVAEASALRRYAELLREFPEAYRDHAIEAFATTDADRAVRLARRELSARPRPRAFLLALDTIPRAAWSRGERCELAQRARPLASVQPTLARALRDVECE